MTSRLIHFCNICDERVDSEHCMFWEVDWHGFVDAICKKCYDKHLEDDIKVWGTDKHDNYFLGEEDPNKYEKQDIIWEVVKIVKLKDTVWDEFERGQYLLGELTAWDCENFDGLDVWI